MCVALGSRKDDDVSNTWLAFQYPHKALASQLAAVRRVTSRPACSCNETLRKDLSNESPLIAAALAVCHLRGRGARVLAASTYLVTWCCRIKHGDQCHANGHASVAAGVPLGQLCPVLEKKARPAAVGRPSPRLHRSLTASSGAIAKLVRLPGATLLTTTALWQTSCSVGNANIEDTALHVKFFWPIPCKGRNAAAAVSPLAKQPWITCHWRTPEPRRAAACYVSCRAQYGSVIRSPPEASGICLGIRWATCDARSPAEHFLVVEVGTSNETHSYHHASLLRLRPHEELHVQEDVAISGQRFSLSAATRLPFVSAYCSQLHEGVGKESPSRCRGPAESTPAPFSSDGGVTSHSPTSVTASSGAIAKLVRLPGATLLTTTALWQTSCSVGNANIEDTALHVKFFWPIPCKGRNAATAVSPLAKQPWITCHWRTPEPRRAAACYVSCRAQYGSVIRSPPEASGICLGIRWATCDARSPAEHFLVVEVGTSNETHSYHHASLLRLRPHEELHVQEDVAISGQRFSLSAATRLPFVSAYCSQLHEGASRNN
ncbi:hypothetical protein HPB52_020291 [Rhipicephalus sanguineus]|uniref:Uncharacterized protein n=1 Tax=Rhipicephalus sanguineus TaxID=34632 RepID=A0A9D4TBJ6_RHISA|nr:hypothetical protein HPB52_020291 [Rhipicephalus sanguineus]